MNRRSARTEARAQALLARPLLVAGAVFLSLVACAPSTVRTIAVEKGDAVLQLETGHPEPDPPPKADMRPLSLLQVEISLKRLVVRPHTFILLQKKESEPLLSEDRVRRYAAALTPSLNALKSPERLWLKFANEETGLLTELRLYLQGEELVYSIVQLYREDQALGRGELFSHGAEVVLQPGQRVVDRMPSDTILLFDPLKPDVLLSAQARADKRSLIDKALEDKVIAAQEADRLRKAVDAHEGVSASAWERFFEKRRTLQKALDQGLLDAAAHAQALTRLEGELGIR